MASGFASFAATPGVRVLTGDYNGDGRSDIALTGVPGWNTIPVAMSQGNGTFATTNLPVGNGFAQFAADARAVVSTVGTTAN